MGDFIFVQVVKSIWTEVLKEMTLQCAFLKMHELRVDVLGDC